MLLAGRGMFPGICGDGIGGWGWADNGRGEAATPAFEGVTAVRGGEVCCATPMPGEDVAARGWYGGDRCAPAGRLLSAV
jgi:hypothetical protein